jgi:signal peptidase II
MRSPLMTRIALAVLTLATIGCDRVTKHLATTYLADRPTRSFLADTVRLTYAENTGGFLSLGANLPPAARTTIFTLATGLVLAVLLVVAWRTRAAGWRAPALALFIAGGVSNWIDRVATGSVVDFLNVGIGWLRTGVFNVADMAIMLGAGLFLLAELRMRSGDVPADRR